MNVNSNLKSITGDPKKAINKLAFPMILSMLLMMFNNIIDSIWVAGLGAASLAAVGYVTPIFTIITGLGNGIGTGANSLIARFIGAKNYKEANNAAIHSIIIAVFLSIIFPIIIVLLLEQLVILMGGQAVLGEAMEYGVIVVIGSYSMLFPGIIASIFRAEGDVKRATIPFVVSAILNIILDPIFIYIFGWGVGGAAIATVLSATVSLIIMLYWIFIKKDTFLEIKRDNFQQKIQMYKDILTVGIPASIEQLVLSFVSVINNYLVTITAGTVAVAAFTAAWRLISIGIMPALGVASATVTVAGIAYGAKNYEKLKISTKYSAILGFIMSVIVSLIFFIFSGQIAQIYAYTSTSAGLAPLIANVIEIMCIFMLAIPFGATACAIFQGLGKGTFSLLLTILRTLVFEEGIAILFVLVLGMGDLGVYWGLNIGAIVASIICYVILELYLVKHKKYFKKDEDAEITSSN